jgi:hypothetical protein
MPVETEETGTARPAPSRTADSYRYAIEYFKRDGTYLGPILIQPDFQPAKDWAYFMGMRIGLPLVTTAAEGSVSPLWCEERGEPYLRGVRVETTAVGLEAVGGFGEPVSCEIPKSYFKSLAERGSEEWVDKGKLGAGERYTYRVCAYPIATDSSQADTQRDGTDELIVFQVEAVSDPIPLMESQLETFLVRATPEGEQFEADVPVFIAQAVIDEACALAAQAGDKETGGVLVGQLHRDSSIPEIFIEVVAQIPAKYAEATGTSFSFTHETWAAADAAIELRGRDEIILGWHHTHPMFCNPECPEERRKLCMFGRPFFSAEDIHLHRVCFPYPYQIALLISDLPDAGLTPALFGWRSGVVSARGYHAVS